MPTSISRSLLLVVAVFSLAHLACAKEPTAAFVPAPRTDPNLKPDFGVTGTFSIVAVDPESGVCGAAVASMYPAVGKVVPFARGGVGAFCTQHWLIKDVGPKALDLLAEGKLPEEVLSTLLQGDPR